MIIRSYAGELELSISRKLLDEGVIFAHWQEISGNIDLDSGEILDGNLGLIGGLLAKAWHEINLETLQALKAANLETTELRLENL